MKLFLDDVRDPATPGFEIVRTVEEAKNFVLKHGIPDFISFDHDLGMKDGEEAPTGYDFAKWLVNYVIIGEHPLPENFDYYVHSMNPVGRDAIERCMNRFVNFYYGQFPECSYQLPSSIKKDYQKINGLYVLKEKT